MRSKVFIVLFALILISVFGLPLTIKGDNTAAGLVQISLTYSLNVVIALISASTLWLGCSIIGTEIENYSIHMITSKPCPRYMIWLGKCSAVVLMHVAILVVSMFIIYGLTSWRLFSAERSGFFSPEDMAKLRQETLVGRRKFYPVPVDLAQQVTAEYERRVRTGQVNPNHDKGPIIDTIRRELLYNAMRNITLKPGESRSWVFRNVTTGKHDNPIFLRFRIYTGDITDTDQRMLPIDWGVAVSSTPDGQALPQNTTEKPVVWYSGGQRDASGNLKPFLMPGGSWQELSTVPTGKRTVTPTQIPVYATQIIDKENQGRVELTLRNLGDMALPDVKSIPANDAEAQAKYQEAVRKHTAIMQVIDGPVLLCEAAGFFNNFLRTMVMAIIQLIFLGALGSSVGAIFSTPVAVAVAVSYIVIGMVVPAAIDAPLQNEEGKYIYNNVYERGAHALARGVKMLVVSVDDLDCTSQLASGQLVEFSDIGGALLKVLLLRTGVITLLGIAVLNRRELGIVVRKVY